MGYKKKEKEYRIRYYKPVVTSPQKYTLHSYSDIKAHSSIQALEKWAEDTDFDSDGYVEIICCESGLTLQFNLR